MAKHRSNASGLHVKTLEGLNELFPVLDIKQEYKINNPRSGSALWLDFYLPTFNIAIEVQGEQHESYSDFFHGDAVAFQRQKNNDEQKELWCTENDITLIKVYWHEDITPELLWDKIEKAT